MKPDHVTYIAVVEARNSCVLFLVKIVDDGALNTVSVRQTLDVGVGGESDATGKIRIVQDIMNV